MTIKNKKRNLKDDFGFAFDMLKENKIKTIILVVVLVIALLTGVIVAIKTKANYDDLESLGVICFSKGQVTSNFFTRLLSMILIALICFGCSFSKFLSPIAFLFLAYRAYLLGINLCLIIIVNGFGGIVSLLIILPCQFIALAILMLFYLLHSKTCSDFKCFGGARVPNQRLLIILATFIFLLIICILESLLLALFSPKVILVI